MQDDNINIDNSAALIPLQTASAALLPEIPFTPPPGATFVSAIAGQSGNVLLSGGTTGFSYLGAAGIVTLLGPLTTKGDLYTFNNLGVGVRLPATTDTFVLTLDSTTATGMKWAAPTTGTVTGTGTAGRVAFWDAASNITSDADLTFATDTLTATKMVATTSINKVAITTPAASATLTIQDGKTLSYEEGTWTPTRVGFTDVLGAGSITSTGTYTRVGRAVVANCLVQPAGGATTAGVAGTSFIKGLPYTVATDLAGSYASEGITFGGATLANGAGANASIFVVTSFAATAQGIVFTVTYFA